MVITYTRPSLPSLRFESLSPPPAETLWPDSDEDGANVHINKKRRIESLGQQYIQGCPLFILSAGLRGPLHDGWVNPWAKRKKTGWVEARGESVEPITARKVTTALSKGSAKDLPQQEILATATTPNLAKIEEEDHVAATDRNTLVSEEQAVADEAMRVVQADTSVSCTKPRKDEVLKTLPRVVGSAEAVAKHPADDPCPKETSWLKSNTTILRSGSRATPKSPTPTPVSRPSPSRRGFAASPAASKAQARQLEPPAFPPPLGFTPINVRRQMGFDKESMLDTNRKTPTALATGDRHKKEASIDQPPAVTEKTLLQADIETREGFLSAKRLSQEAVRHAELQDGYLAARNLSQEAAKRALDASPTPHTGLSTARENPPNYCARSKGPLVGKSANSGGNGSKESGNQMPSTVSHTLSNVTTIDHFRTNPRLIEGPPHALPISTSPAGFLHHWTTSVSGSSSLESTPYPQALEAAKAQAVKRLSFTASGNVKFGSPSPPNAQRSTAEPTSQASPLSQHAGKPQGKTKSNSKASTYSAADMIPPRDISDTSRVLPDAQGLSRQADISEPVQSAPSTNLLETDIQSVKFVSTEEGDSDSHFSTQAAVLKAQRSFQTALVSPIKDPSMYSAPVRQMQNPGSIGLGVTAENGMAAITPFRTFHRVYEDPLERTKSLTMGEVPMSTQAMIDAASPFARSTIKKSLPKKKASFVPSPTEGKGLGSEADIDGGFGKLGLDMETSPDVSDNEVKPSSNAPPAVRSLSKQSSSIHLQLSPAFSIAPNGTLTEVFQQDGQRPTGEWDLNTVIDDAGSFLGTWDVDNELKRGKVSSCGKGISEGGSKG